MNANDALAKALGWEWAGSTGVPEVTEAVENVVRDLDGLGYVIVANGLPDETPIGRMDAYYYNFERTGVLAIDRILSAVAQAGKSAHHTDAWNELGLVDAIQAAANAAARSVGAED